MRARLTKATKIFLKVEYHFLEGLTQRSWVHVISITGIDKRRMLQSNCAPKTQHKMRTTIASPTCQEQRPVSISREFSDNHCFSITTNIKLEVIQWPNWSLKFQSLINARIVKVAYRLQKERALTQKVIILFFVYKSHGMYLKGCSNYLKCRYC